MDRIRELVLSGAYAPGDPLSEIFLAQQFAVSRTPVRESLKQLERESLIEIKPKVGTFVREPTKREIVELFQLKEGLEGLAAGLMARRGRTAHLEFLEQNVRASEAAAIARDSGRYAQLVHEFHWGLVNGSDNSKLIEHYRLLMNQLAFHRLVLKTVENPKRIAVSSGEHRQVLQMIQDKDHFGAEAAMRNHVYASARELLGGSREAPEG
ncbi:GntR family transcriptional regulator [Arthrobacter sp. MYb211]|nr:GntR family transcriptional regulator [Arthrobacter sp. MYb229]PRA12039.1 GntR family transcriptional regulator [Arthrobacter sp. MYb221]PRB49787.1 GntR family transcriptional regulator [Arthrobacter sp. MYb216]PRC08394.1 GntR family transcriptional regulator [Arthrobacter sp. MYb211]